MISKHRGGFPEGQSPIVLDTLSNAEYDIKYYKNKVKERKTVYNTLQKHVNGYTFMYNVINFLLIIPSV